MSPTVFMSWRRLLMAALIACLPAIATAAEKVLPESVAHTIRARFPNAEIVNSGKEREKGTDYYEVVLREGKSLYEVEIALDGSVGEIEARISPSDLEGPIRDRIRSLVGRSPQVRIERHERHGRPNNGTFEPLEFPVIVYEVKFVKDGKLVEVELDEKTAILPEDVAKAISRHYGKSTILGSRAERMDKLDVFVVSLEFRRERVDATFSPSGELMVEAMPVKKSDVSNAALRTVGKRAEKAEYYKAVRRRTYAETVDGEVDKLRGKTEEYDVYVRRGDKMKVYTVDRKGELLGEGDWEELDDDDDDDDEDDD